MIKRVFELKFVIGENKKKKIKGEKITFDIESNKIGFAAYFEGELMLERQYYSNLEEYWFMGNDVLFDTNLKNFTGSITRKYAPSFRQKSCENEDLYGSVREKIHRILNGEKSFNPMIGNFLTYLYSPILNEIVMFFYNSNKHRKRLVYNIIDMVSDVKNHDDLRFKIFLEDVYKKINNYMDISSVQTQLTNFYLFSDKKTLLPECSPYIFQFLSFLLFEEFMRI